MVRRLVEVYRIGAPVEIFLQDEESADWRPAHIVALQHPGVWAQTEDGRIWYVTNGKRIRLLPPPLLSHLSGSGEEAGG